MKKEKVEKRIAQEPLPQRHFPVLTIALFIVYLGLTLAFLFFLDAQKATGFGFMEIIASVIIAFVLSMIFSWCKSLERNNPYLGFLISIVVLALFFYGMSIYYKGIYTMSFLATGAVITLVYMAYYLIKYRILEKREAKEIK
jgi:cation transport ATPase